MTNSIPEVQTGGVRSALTEPRGLLWTAILTTFLLIFAVTGYIAFFDNPYNPAQFLTETQVKLLRDDSTKGAVSKALEQEAAAFKAKKDLAFQSFNVVLGALLGFLSASAAGAVRRDPR